MATRAQITKLFSMLGVAYPRYALSGEKLAQAVEVWHELLGDLDFGLLEAVVYQHCTTSQWFPSIAEIRTAALDLMEPAGWDSGPPGGARYGRSPKKARIP